MLRRPWSLLRSHLNECSVEKQRKFRGTGERKEHLGESGVPEAAKRKCYLIRALKDRRDIFIGWVRGGKLIVRRPELVLICVSYLEDITGDISPE